jgi:hypothetical protein
MAGTEDLAPLPQLAQKEGEGEGDSSAL